MSAVTDTDLYAIYPPYTLFESLSAWKRYYWAISCLNAVWLCFSVGCFISWLPDTHSIYLGTPILGLCHGVFTDKFICRHILGHFFLRKENLYRDYERIRSIRYQKEKLNVIKRHFRSVGFADWIVKFKRFSKFALKTVLKINWSVKKPWHERMEVARSEL